MVKGTNGARRVGGGASLMGVSVSPTVSKLGGSVSREGKYDLTFLREDEDPVLSLSRFFSSFVSFSLSFFLNPELFVSRYKKP